MERAPADEERGTRTSLRMDGPDGTAVEYVRTDDGTISRVRFGAGGEEVSRVVARSDLSGAVSVTACEVNGGVEAVTPLSVRRRSNPYGASTEVADYGPDLSVQQSFDDDGQIREITVRGPWGEQTMALRADGSRTMRWRTPLHQGSQAWDADGARTSYDLTSADGTTYRWSATRPSGRPGPSRPSMS